MPRRTREHEIEEESRLALSRAIGPSWVVRAVHEDYGVDREIEIFDEGRATGLSIKVQLKGTDSTIETPKVQVNRDHVSYWRSLDAPLLLVRYRSSDQSLWSMWATDARLSSRPGSRSVTARFRASEQWVGDPKPILLRAAIQRRVRRSGGLVYPLVAFVEVEPSLRHMALELIDCLTDSGLVRFEPDPHSECDLRVGIARGEIVVDLIAGASARCPSPRALPDGLLHAFAGLLFDTLCLESVLSADRAASLLLSTSIGAEDARRAVASARHLLNRGHGAEVAAALVDLEFAVNAPAQVRLALLVALIEYSSDPHGDQRVAILYHAAVLQRASELSSDAARAVAFYNAGHQLGAVPGANVEALELYDRAAQMDPSYLERHYWWAETGALLFGQGDLVESETRYARAVTLGAAYARPRLADVLFRRGRFEEALTEIRLSESQFLSLASWQLLSQALELLVEEWRVSESSRDIDGAAEIAEADPAGALQLDPICAHAHWQMANELADAPEEVAKHLILAAAADPEDALVMARLVVSATPDVAPLAFRFARRTQRNSDEVVRILSVDADAHMEHIRGLRATPLERSDQPRAQIRFGDMVLVQD